MPTRRHDSRIAPLHRNGVTEQEAWGALTQRVYQVENEISALDTRMAARFNDLSSELGALGTRFDERSRTPWAIIISAGGLIVAVMSVLGGLAYWPINRDLDKLGQVVEKVIEKQVPRVEQEAQRAERARELVRITDDLRTLEMRVVPRGEHEQRWERFVADVSHLQAQIDDLKKSQGETYTARDAILDLKSRIDDLERQIRNGGSKFSP